MVYKRNGREISMRIEELSPLKELAFNYVKNTLKEDIKLEDVHSIFIGINGVKVSFNIAKQAINLKFEDLGIEYDNRDEYEKEVYTSSINHVVRLLTGEEHNYFKIPNIPSLLQLNSLGNDSIKKFLHQQIESFTKEVTGDSNTVERYYTEKDGIKVITMDEDTYEQVEYFFPNELLSMTGYEAKELYADTLAKVEEEKKQYYINNLKNDIKMYEKSLTEKKKQLEELEKL
jgi:hypothetical protein